MVNKIKVDCKLHLNGRELSGLAHVIIVTCGKRISFCNFIMQLTTDQSKEITDKDLESHALLILPDGRQAGVDIRYGDMSGDYFELAGTGIFQN